MDLRKSKQAQMNDYSNTAYRFKMRQNHSKYRSHKFSGMERLPHGDYRNVDPNTYLYDTHEIIHAPDPTKEEEINLPFRFDTKKIRTVTSTRMYLAIFFTFGGYVLLLGSGFGFVVNILMFMYEFSFGMSFDVSMRFIKVSIVCIGVSLSMIGVTKLPYSILKHIFGEAVPKLELNRRTGMVTIWKYMPILGFRRRTIVKPFSEFVPYLQHIVTTTGTGAGWGVLLMHKDSRSISFGSKGLVNVDSKGDALAFWDFLQRYMDVDEPVPEIPLLEASRALDPTTRAFDKANTRPSKYWRSMSHEGINRKAGDIANYVTRLVRGENLPAYKHDYFRHMMTKRK